MYYEIINCSTSTIYTLKLAPRGSERVSRIMYILSRFLKLLRKRKLIFYIDFIVFIFLLEGSGKIHVTCIITRFRHHCRLLSTYTQFL